MRRSRQAAAGIGKFVTSAFLSSVILLAGRVSGFVREIEIGYFFGLSREADFTVLLLSAPTGWSACCSPAG